MAQYVNFSRHKKVMSRKEIPSLKLATMSTPKQKVLDLDILAMSLGFSDCLCQTSQLWVSEVSSLSLVS